MDSKIKDHLNHHINNALFGLSAEIEMLKEKKTLKIVKDEAGQIVSADPIPYTIDDAYESIREHIKRISKAVSDMNENKI